MGGSPEGRSSLGRVQGDSACRVCRGQRPCRESKGQRPWVGCRVTTPARMQGEALPGVQGRSVLGRVQGGSACADAREGLARSPEAERSGPVKCRKRSGPKGSTLCTGYYPSKTGALRETHPASETMETLTNITKENGGEIHARETPCISPQRSSRETWCL